MFGSSRQFDPNQKLVQFPYAKSDTAKNKILLIAA